MADVLTCENCGGTIGKLEAPRVFNDATVCAGCWKRLNADTPVADVARAAQREAVGYESRQDTARRMGAKPGAVLAGRGVRPTGVDPQVGVVSRVGRVVFGIGALVFAALFVFGLMGGDERLKAVAVVLLVVDLIFLGLCHVTRVA